MRNAENTPLTGVRLSVDVGRARVGVAATDPMAILATPVQTLKRDQKDFRDIARIVSIAQERDAVRIYVGDPQNMRGEVTESTRDARAYAARLAADLDAAGLSTQVRMVDERLSTASASKSMSRMGRSTRNQRAVIDQAAAVEILEHALDLEKIHGAEAGDLIIPDAASEASSEQAGG